MAADATPSAPLMQWVQMIDGHVGEGPMESEVRLVPVLLEPQQTKLGLDTHGRVVDFMSL